MFAEHVAPNPVPILNTLPARRAPDWPPLPCRARIHWATGEEWIDTTAHRYDPKDQAVFVEVRDTRCLTIGAWLPRADVHFTRLLEDRSPP